MWPCPPALSLLFSPPLRPPPLGAGAPSEQLACASSEVGLRRRISKRSRPSQPPLVGAWIAGASGLPPPLPSRTPLGRQLE